MNNEKHFFKYNLYIRIAAKKESAFPVAVAPDRTPEQQAEPQ
jgi:hypothetical protein